MNKTVKQFTIIMACIVAALLVSYIVNAVTGWPFGSFSR